MTAKEKAKQLVEAYIYRDIRGFTIERMSLSLAKQCALISVDEIISANEKISLKDLRETMQTNDILCQLTDNAMYWQKVKKEIKDL